MFVILKFSESLIKVKTKLLILSCICLFIGLTEALPKKIAVLGLDLTNNSDVAGWFVFVITLYFFVVFLVNTGIELIKYYFNSFIIFKSKHFTGDVIGLTERDCIADDLAHNSNEEDVGNTRSEYRDIQNKKKELSAKSRSIFIFISNSTTIIFEAIFPIVLWCFGSWELYNFLICMQ